jgi:predicted HicB family RNase H-like nuclease
MSKRTPTPPPPADTTRRINIAIPADLHRDLRIAAATEGNSIQDTVVAALRAYLA